MVLKPLTAISERHRETDEFRFLAEAGAILSRSLDISITLQAVANLAVPILADWCAVDLLSPDGQLESVARAHADPRKLEWIRSLGDTFKHNMEAAEGMPNVVRNGVTELYGDILNELVIPKGAGAEEIEMVETAGFRAVVLVPLTVRGQHIGGMAFVSATPGRYSEGDVVLFDQIAKRSAVAIDNARLYSMAQRELVGRIEAEAELRANEVLLEARVRQRTQELVSAYRQLESFSYSVSHDLRAPLRAISAAIGILLADHGDVLDDDGRNELVRADAATKRMTRLIEDLLEYGRVGTATIALASVDVTELARSVATELERPSASSGPSGVLIEEGLATDADPSLLRVVLQNLIENALKFSRDQSAPAVEIGYSSAEGAFYVRDNGIGFDGSLAEKVFEPFQRLTATHAYPGSGIGLANVKRIIERHGGRIWAKSEPGTGAVFYFTVSVPK